MSAMRRSREDGFTLIELLIVVVIIGLLAGIAIPVFLDHRKKALAAQAMSDLRNLATAEEANFAEAGVYSASIPTLATQGYRRTAGLRLGIAVSTPGYCEAALVNGTYVWFDSAAAGLQSATTSSLTPPTGTGACQAAAPTTVG